MRSGCIYLRSVIHKNIFNNSCYFSYINNELFHTSLFPTKCPQTCYWGFIFLCGLCLTLNDHFYVSFWNVIHSSLGVSCLKTVYWVCSSWSWGKTACWGKARKVIGPHKEYVLKLAFFREQNAKRTRYSFRDFPL